jgi:redox-sensitive bicupin YhaK (pirin superfamily)
MATILGSDDEVGLALHPAGGRPRTVVSGRVTAHSFSFGAHYDPENVAFAGLLVHNDDHLQPGTGYADHPHADVEIVTWVVDGVLAHRDDQGGVADLGAGTVQVQSAGAGIRHSEIADPGAGPTRFVQAWVRPDLTGTVPRRAVAAADPALTQGSGALVPVVSGARPALLDLGAASATLWAARLAPGDVVLLPEDRLQHVFVVGGRLTIADHDLSDGDAVRITDEPGHRVVARAPGELLVWSFAG